jgi:hypothetical protein
VDVDTGLEMSASPFQQPDTDQCRAVSLEDDSVDGENSPEEVAGGVLSSCVVTPERQPTFKVRHNATFAAPSPGFRTPLGRLTNMSTVNGSPGVGKAGTPARLDATLAVPVPVAFRLASGTASAPWKQADLIVEASVLRLQPHERSSLSKVVELPLVNAAGNGLVITANIDDSLAQRFGIGAAERARALLLQQQLAPPSPALAPSCLSPAPLLSKGYLLLADCEEAKQALVAELIVGAAGSQLTRWDPRSLGPLPRGTRVTGACPLPGDGGLVLLACNTGLCVTRLGCDGTKDAQLMAPARLVQLPLVRSDDVSKPLEVAQIAVVSGSDAVLMLGSGQMHLLSLSAVTRACHRSLAVGGVATPVQVYQLPFSEGAQNFAAGEVDGDLYVLAAHGSHMSLLGVQPKANGLPDCKLVKKAKGAQCCGTFPCLTFLPSLGKFAWGSRFFSTLEPLTLDVEPFLLQRDPQWAVHLQLEQVQSVFPLAALEVRPGCFALCYNSYALLVNEVGEPIDDVRYCVQWTGRDPQDFIAVGRHLLAFSRGCAEVHDLETGDHYNIPLHRAGTLCVVDKLLLLTARAPGGDAQLLLLQQPASRSEAVAHWGTPRPDVAFQHDFLATGAVALGSSFLAY